MGEVMLDPDDHPERRDLGYSRPDACDSRRDDYDVWLDPGMQTSQRHLRTAEALRCPAMRCYPVSTRINHVANDDEEVLSTCGDCATSEISLFVNFSHRADRQSLAPLTYPVNRVHD